MTPEDKNNSSPEGSHTEMNSRRRRQPSSADKVRAGHRRRDEALAQITTAPVVEISNLADCNRRWPFMSNCDRRSMTPPQSLANEDREMASVEAELADEFRDVDPQTIHALVAEGYAALTPAKVTSFLPILVIRSVQTRLRLDTVA